MIKKLLTVFLLVFCLLLPLTVTADFSMSKDAVADLFLKNIGMPEELLATLSSEVKEFIVQDLQSNPDNGDTIEFIDAEPAKLSNTSPKTNDDISFTAAAFKSGNVISVYPIYEFNMLMSVNGNDGFALQFGSALSPYDYTGKVWYRSTPSSSWTAGSNMSGTYMGNRGILYSGTQLGNYSNKYVRGCAVIHASAGAGSSKKLDMKYISNPSGLSISVTFSTTGEPSITVSPTTLVTFHKTILLSY